MPVLTGKWAFLIAALAGAGLWLATSWLSGRREAWDAPMYWSVAYPAAILISGILGYLAADQAWRWGLIIMLAQAVTMALVSSSFGLLPLGLIMFAVLAVPPMLVARFGAGLRARSSPVS